MAQINKNYYCYSKYVRISNQESNIVLRNQLRESLAIVKLISYENIRRLTVPELPREQPRQICRQNEDRNKEHMHIYGR